MEALALVADVSVGLAGFAGVVVLLGRGPGRWTAADAARIRLLLGAAFGALFGSLVPVGLVWAGVSQQLTLQVGSAFLLLVYALWSVGATRALADLPSEERWIFNPQIARAMRVLAIGTMGALLLAASGLAMRATAGILFLGLFLLLGYTAFGFVRLMFVRPGSE